MLVTCSNCGARNRVNQTLTESLRPKCGRCGMVLEVVRGSTPPDISDTPIEVTDDSLGALLGSAGDKPVLLDCWAAWCPPCRAIALTIEQLAAESAGRYFVAKIDVDSNPRTASSYKVEGIPAVLIFKRGQLVDHLVGLQPKPSIMSRLQAHL